jgi:hypothetical protein
MTQHFAALVHSHPRVQFAGTVQLENTIRSRYNLRSGSKVKNAQRDISRASSWRGGRMVNAPLRFGSGARWRFAGQLAYMRGGTPLAIPPPSLPSAMVKTT